MKAAVYQNYGSPEVVQIQEVDIPSYGKKDILVKVIASTVNRTDAGFRSAEYFVSRFWTGLWKPKHQILGCEFAGIIVEIGSEVSTFKIGDRVFGFNDKTCGGHGEYLSIAEQDAVALIPNGLDFETAAALTEGSHYALNNIRAAKVQKGQQVLVYGATGAIGSAAIQLLKYFEVHVTAVCNTKNVALVKSLGADVVIDYETEDFSKTTKKYNFIFDAVGKTSFGVCKPLLTEFGIYQSTELGKNAENIFYALIGPFTKGKKVLFPIPTITKEDVVFLKTLAERKAFKPLIDRSYLLEEIVEAYHYVGKGQKLGNVILKIQQ